MYEVLFHTAEDEIYKPSEIVAGYEDSFADVSSALENVDKTVSRWYLMEEVRAPLTKAQIILVDGDGSRRLKSTIYGPF